MWSDLPKVVQNNKLDFYIKVDFNRNKQFQGEFPKFYLETKIFVPAADFHGHEL